MENREKHRRKKKVNGVESDFDVGTMAVADDCALLWKPLFF